MIHGITYERYENGNLMSEYSYVDKPHGMSKDWYENGNLMREKTLRIWKKTRYT